ncbi:hypothetical protein JZ751_028949, partial [Albula glossodonta]
VITCPMSTSSLTSHAMRTLTFGYFLAQVITCPMSTSSLPSHAVRALTFGYFHSEGHYLPHVHLHTQLPRCACPYLRLFPWPRSSPVPCPPPHSSPMLCVPLPLAIAMAQVITCPMSTSSLTSHAMRTLTFGYFLAQRRSLPAPCPPPHSTPTLCVPLPSAISMAQVITCPMSTSSLTSHAVHALTFGYFHGPGIHLPHVHLLTYLPRRAHPYLWLFPWPRTMADYLLTKSQVWSSQRDRLGAHL